MKLLLIVTGALSLIVLAAPGIVVLGYFFLIIPGIILTAMPTLFGYLLATAVLRAALPLPAGPVGTVVAALAAITLGWLAAQPARVEALARFKLAQQREVTPSAPIHPQGHVRLERSRFIGESEGCDALCAALLATPAVASVTIVDADEGRTVARATYRLAAKGSVPENALRPVKVSTFREYTGRDGHKKREADEKALATTWALRLATTDTLAAESPRVGGDITIALTEQRGTGPRIQRVEVRRGDTVLLRRSLVISSRLAAPVHLTLSGGISNVKWVWARSPLCTGPRFAEFKHERELLAHLALATPSLKEEAGPELFARLEAALDGSGPSSDLQLASPWLEAFGYTAPEGLDSELVGRFLAEPRITDLKYFFKTHEKIAPVRLRAMIVTRFLMPSTSSQDRSRLARLLKQMPEGTFARLSDDERTILGMFEYRRDAGPFIERLADGGPTALRNLVAILQDSARVEPWHARQDLVRGARRGLARLGPAAAPALPTVLRLFGASGSQLTNDSNGSREWRIAMVRMGLDPAKLPWPKSWDQAQIARERADVQAMVQRHDATWESGYNY